MTVVVWIFQIIFSSWWLSGHKFGPIEWVLRWFTYGQTIAIKRDIEQIEHTDLSVMMRVP